MLRRPSSTAAWIETTGSRVLEKKGTVYFGTYLSTVALLGLLGYRTSLQRME